jgi:acetyl-CoA carboxylase carboxyl transferase subunit alpha
MLPFERPIQELEQRLRELESQSDPAGDLREHIRAVRLEIAHLRREIYDDLDPWHTVRFIARHPERPQTLDYIELLFDEFVELHGDRAFGDDRAILTGFGRLDDQRVMFIGQSKGRNSEERNECFYGCAHPEGYRKALLRMELAAKYGLPVVCFIDTPGAFPGVGAEERGQAYNIAFNLREMSRIGTPIVCVVIGEGGADGALGIAIGDHVAMLQHAYYSVLAPEGCAGILWKHPRHADEASRALKFTSRDLLRFGVIDEIISEPPGGAHRDHRQMAAVLRSSLNRQLKTLAGIPIPELLDRRYEKFRRIGAFEEGPLATAATPPI